MESVPPFFILLPPTLTLLTLVSPACSTAMAARCPSSPSPPPPTCRLAWKPSDDKEPLRLLLLFLRLLLLFLLLHRPAGAPIRPGPPAGCAPSSRAALPGPRCRIARPPSCPTSATTSPTPPATPSNPTAARGCATCWAMPTASGSSPSSAADPSRLTASNSLCHHPPRLPPLAPDWPPPSNPRPHHRHPPCRQHTPSSIPSPAQAGSQWQCPRSCLHVPPA